MRRPQPHSERPPRLRQADNASAIGIGGADDGSVTLFHYPGPFTPEGTVRETGVQRYLPDSRTTTIAIDRSPGRTGDAPTLARGPRRTRWDCRTACSYGLARSPMTSYDRGRPDSVYGFAPRLYPVAAFGLSRSVVARPEPQRIGHGGAVVELQPGWQAISDHGHGGGLELRL